MSMVAGYLIEVFGVMFDRNFIMVSNVRSNDCFEQIRDYLRIFLFDDEL
jgi:hypothetical protein